MNMIAKRILFSIILSFISNPTKAIDSPGYEVKLDKYGIKVAGKYRLLRGGSVQWARLPEEVWEDRLMKMKTAGFNTVGMYIPWNVIEPEKGRFNFEKPNIKRFLELAKKIGLFVIVRPGPYITNEMDGGGLPAWLTKNASKQSFEEDGMVNLRTHDPDFINPTRDYFNALNEEIWPYFAQNGGPIILYVVENEYTWFERAFTLDKLFFKDFMPERPIFQKMPTKKYMTLLRDIVKESGVTIPVVTNPGDGKASGTGNIPDLAPFPSFYEWALPYQPEEAAVRMISDMHRPNKYNGVYQNTPTGSLETNRNPQEFRRFLVGGLDLILGFNMAGIIQEGFKNGMTLAARAQDQPPHWGIPGEKANDWISSIFKFSNWDLWAHGFGSPDAGYFGNVLDYKGPISPSGIVRETFYRFRRDNLFFDVIEEDLARNELPQIRRNQCDRSHFCISDTNLGSREKQGHMLYYHNLRSGAALLSIVNQTGHDVRLDRGGIRFRGYSFPRFTSFTVPTALNSRKTYDLLLLHNYPINSDLKIVYTTSELLTRRPFGTEELIVLYGRSQDEGEIQLAASDLSVKLIGESLNLEEKTNKHITITYTYGEDQQIIVGPDTKKPIRILVTTREKVRKLWFVKKDNTEILVSGPDYLTKHEDAWRMDFPQDQNEVYIMSPKPIFIDELTSIAPFNPETKRSKFEAHFESKETLPQELDHGNWLREHADFNRRSPDAIWTGDAKSMEQLGVYKGRGWYVSDFHLKHVPHQRDGYLYVDSASDIIGIYLNGTYVTTVAPLGTEINNHTWDKRYKFTNLSSYLKQGKNIIAFRTEIWGHGSFMFGTSSVIGTRAKLPSLGLEGQKGIIGRVTVAHQRLIKWKFYQGFDGDHNGFYHLQDPSHGWQEGNFPKQLRKGDLLWLKAKFEAQLCEDEEYRAPPVVEIKGKNAKGTIYLNDRVFGRWISDNQWLQQGVWATPQKGMWVELSSDQFPIPCEVLSPEGDDMITILVEDTSHSHSNAGSIESIKIKANHEDFIWNKGGFIFSEGSYYTKSFTLSDRPIASSFKK